MNESERRQRIAGKPTEALYPYFGANGQVGWIDEFLFDEPLILLAEDGGNFGSRTKPVAYAVAGKYWVNNHAHCLRPKLGVSFEFLRHALSIRPDIGELVSGSTRGKLNQEVAGKVEIPLPPLAEQERIAGRLTKQLAAVERARAAAQARLAAAEALPAAYLREVLPGPEQDLPEGWRWGTISEVAKKVPTGATFDRQTSKPSGLIPIIDQSQSGVLGFHDGPATIAASEHRPIVTFANHTCAVRFHTRPFSVIQNVFPLASTGAATPEYLYWVLKGRLPSTFYGGHWPLLIDVPLPLPPTLGDQRQIAADLARRLGEGGGAEHLAACIREELAVIQTLPAALLRAAFGGEPGPEHEAEA